MKNFTIIILFTVLISCADNNKNSTTNLADDYTVYNQVLPQLGVFELCLDCPNDVYLSKYNYDSIETKNILEFMINKGIDTNNNSIKEICILAIGDSLHKFKYKGFESKESIKVDLNKINPKPKCLLVTWDSIPFNKNKYSPDQITLSRVLFNKDKTKAVFSIGMSRGSLWGRQDHIFVENKDGKWIIVEKNMILVD
ncbi:hypothetical protein ACFLSV_00445 [Bacteroidota bacterium]